MRSPLFCVCDYYLLSGRFVEAKKCQFESSVMTTARNNGFVVYVKYRLTIPEGLRTQRSVLTGTLFYGKSTEDR